MSEKYNTDFVTLSVFFPEKIGLSFNIGEKSFFIFRRFSENSILPPNIFQEKDMF